MKTTHSINNYYNQRIKKLEYDKKDKLNKLNEGIEKMKEHKKEQLEKKVQRKINQIEKDRARKLKNITLVQKGKPPKEKKKIITSSRYMNKADWYFSRVVRSIGAFQENGERYNYDYTGKIKMRIKDLTCGHFITRGVYTLRYDLNNIFAEGELQEDPVVSILETTAEDGKNYQVKYYNLDVIVAVGYRVNSYKATQFRIRATATLREYIIKGFIMDDNRLKNGKLSMNNIPICENKTLQGLAHTIQIIYYISQNHAKNLQPRRTRTTKEEIAEENKPNRKRQSKKTQEHYSCAKVKTT